MYMVSVFTHTDSEQYMTAILHAPFRCNGTVRDRERAVIPGVLPTNPVMHALLVLLASCV